MPHKGTNTGKPGSHQLLAAAPRSGPSSAIIQPNSPISHSSGPFSRPLSIPPARSSWLASPEAQLPSSSASLAAEPLRQFPSKAPQPRRSVSSFAARAAKSPSNGSASNGSISQEELQQAEAARLAELERRLKGIREQMQKANGGQGVDAFVIPAEDAHQVSLRLLTAHGRDRRHLGCSFHCRRALPGRAWLIQCTPGVRHSSTRLLY